MFRYSKKTQNLKKYPNLFDVPFKSKVKNIVRVFIIFLAFSEYLNFSF